MQTQALAQPASAIEQMNGTWWLAQTRPQYEHRLAHDLQLHGIDYVLPLNHFHKTKTSRGREYQASQSKPALPYYVFINYPDPLYPPDAACRSIAKVRITRVVNQVGLAKQLSDLCLALEDDPELGMRNGIEKGRRVRVTRGRLMGIEGEAICSNDGKCHVQISIALLGKSTILEVPPDCVELI